jgi:hypothetical protein
MFGMGPVSTIFYIMLKCNNIFFLKSSPWHNNKQTNKPQAQDNDDDGDSNGNVLSSVITPWRVGIEETISTYRGQMRIY